ncbi:MAG TPA: ATP-binding protein [Anaerolineales bacterium]|nr:ATP-binding protein [Anaerolineales bacterium]
MRTAKQPSPPSEAATAEVSRQTFPAESEQLRQVCESVREAASLCGFDERTSYACQLATCEAVENVIQHGYRGAAGGQVTVETRARPGDLVVEIVDDAPPFDPTSYPLVSDASPDDMQVGGRGILMIHRVMDDVHYERRGNKNHLRLTKNRAFTGA